MAQSSMKASGDKEYLASGRWKCEKSPSGAHHWVVESYEMTCRYCADSKEINSARFGWTKPGTK